MSCAEDSDSASSQSSFPKSDSSPANQELSSEWMLKLSVLWADYLSDYNWKIRARSRALEVAKYSWNHPAHQQSWYIWFRAHLHDIEQSTAWTLVRITFIARTRWCPANHCCQHNYQRLPITHQNELSSKIGGRDWEYFRRLNKQGNLARLYV